MINKVRKLIAKSSLVFILSLFTADYAFGVIYDTSVNLISVNPSFESNTWGWYNAGGTIDSTTASDGVRSGKLSATAGQTCDWRSQGYTTVVPGESYKFIFDYKTSSGATGKPQIRLRFYAISGGAFMGEIQRDLSLTNNNWQTVTATMACPNVPCTVDVFYTTNRFGSFNGYAWLDNVKLHPELEELYVPADGSEGWSDEPFLRWPEVPEADAYLLYTGNSYEEVDAAEYPIYPGDFDLDAKVDLEDFALLGKQWLTGELPASGPVADTNNDGLVDISDLSTVATYFTESNEIPLPFEMVRYDYPFKKIYFPGSDATYYWRVDTLIDGEVERGPTLEFSCRDYLDYNIAEPTYIYYVRDTYMSQTQQVMFQSLEGLIARDKPELYLLTSWNEAWLADLKSNYGINYTSAAGMAGGGDKALGWVLDRYASRYSGYILCDSYNDPDSLTAAISLAAAMESAIVVDVEDEGYMTSRNKPRLADMRGKDEKWVWDNYKDNFTKEAIFVQRSDINSHGKRLRDLPITLRALTWWNSSYNDTEEVFSEYKKNIPCYGWDSPVMSGEGGAVRYHSEHSMYTVVTDWSLNLSLFAGMASHEPKITFKQPCSDNKYTSEDNVHYVTFIISDMDNANVLFDYTGWAVNTNRYASPYRGRFAMGWGMPPLMTKLGPSVMKWWYSRATEKDCFVGYCSGADYFNPSHFPDLDIHTSHLVEYIKEADLKTMLIIDGLMPEKSLSQDYYEVAKHYTIFGAIRGLFYLEYQRYAPYDGDIYWFDGKPMMTARYDFRSDAFYSAVRTTPESLAASINALPATPENQNGYTFVTVHAWSKGWNDVLQCINLLDSDVRVVTPNEIIEQLYMHNVEE